MTAQTPDIMRHRGKDYNVVGVKSGCRDRLPTPDDFGMRAGVWTTGCWRGFVRTFSVVDNCLLLTALRIGCLAEGEEWKAINGVRPEPFGIRNGEYHGLKVSLNISCGMVVGHSIIGDLGLWPPGAYQYESVLELLFHEGTLIEEIDHTDTARAWRIALGWEHAERSRRFEELRSTGLSNNEIMRQLPSWGDGDETRQIRERFFSDYRFDYCY